MGAEYSVLRAYLPGLSPLGLKTHVQRTLQVIVAFGVRIRSTEYSVHPPAFLGVPVVSLVALARQHEDNSPAARRRPHVRMLGLASVPVIQASTEKAVRILVRVHRLPGGLNISSSVWSMYEYSWWCKSKGGKGNQERPLSRGKLGRAKPDQARSRSARPYQYILVLVGSCKTEYADLGRHLVESSQASDRVRWAEHVLANQDGGRLGMTSRCVEVDRVPASASASVCQRMIPILRDWDRALMARPKVQRKPSDILWLGCLGTLNREKTG